MSTTLPEGFTIRPATMDDVEAVTGLVNGCHIEQTGKPTVEAHQIRSDWESPGFDVTNDTIVVIAPDGKLVGHAAVWDNEPHVQIHVDADVHPEYRGQGVGTAISQWAEARARQAIPKAPDGARVVLIQGKLSTNTDAQALLRQQGYQLVRHGFIMIIEMDESPLEPVVPEGIIIRPLVRDKEIRALTLAYRDAYKDHWGYVEAPFEEELQRVIHWIDNDPDYDPSLWFVAVEGEEIVGMSLCRPKTAEDPEMSWVNLVAVRRPWRRRGVALALLRHSFGQLYRRSKHKVGLGVDAQSLTGATRLYEKAGMRVERQYVQYEQELRAGEDLSTQSVED